MIDLNPSHLDTVRAILAQHVPDCEVRAFGSRVTWTAKDYSDLDLAVVGRQALDADRLRILREAFEDSSLPFRVDVVDWHALSDGFRKVIQGRCEVIWQGAPSVVGSGRASKWAPLRLGSVCSRIGSGATPRGGGDVYMDAGPYALIRSQNVHNDGFHREGLAYIGEEHAAQLANVEVHAGDVLLNITGDSVARACQVDPGVLPARVNQHVAIIRPEPATLDPRFLRYFLVSPEMQSKLLSWAGSGGTRNALTKGMIESFDVLAPEDVAEQRAIAHILGTLDDKIELNRRMSDTLEAMARALFKSWFVDFDPVRAKAEGRDPRLADAVAALFPDALTEHPDLGEIPEGWCVGPILDRARLLSGGTPMTARPEYWDGPIPWASAKDVSQSREPFLVASERAITERGLNESATQIVPVFSSVVVARGATTGRMVLFGRDMAMNQTCYALTTTTETPFALYCQMRHEIGTLVHAAHGSVFDTITMRTFASSRVVLPPQPLLRAFEDRAGPLLLRVLACTSESRTLAALRDALLPKLISGDLRLDDPERILGRAG